MSHSTQTIKPEPGRTAPAGGRTDMKWNEMVNEPCRKCPNGCGELDYGYGHIHCDRTCWKVFIQYCPVCMYNENVAMMKRGGRKAARYTGGATAPTGRKIDMKLNEMDNEPRTKCPNGCGELDDAYGHIHCDRTYWKVSIPYCPVCMYYEDAEAWL